ncbi:pentatricopeptide repeat-containing protein At2g01860 [Juglans microcarpa x Juglans regia]|uniref:pentatricopeptide repeat-containing protein At2g01860 n=1 Tax=Juglans microcarpa x Juglans regia TaxID=2249226 RepID=UPI001B7D9514|nr:pentatricopeptide repeat-containing protein At2g01860 [Juglans microcarpa x Juglans regia]
MDFRLSTITLYPIPSDRNFTTTGRVTLLARSKTRRRPPKNLRYPRHPKSPPNFGVNLFLKKRSTNSTDISLAYLIDGKKPRLAGKKGEGEEQEQEQEQEDTEEEEGRQETGICWDSDEIEAISSLFQGRVPQKPGKLNRERPLPLPLPYKLRPLGLPTPKKHVKSASPLVASSRASLSKQVYKNPGVLIGIAREIKVISSEEDVSVVLNKWARFLRKGSLSLTIRELGHMGLPERALQTFCWAQKQPQLFPDDRILASTVEVLARNHQLKVPFNLGKFTSLASRGVMEAMVRGFIRGGSLHLAWKLLSVARDGKRMLDPSIYAKLILELGKNPDKHMLVVSLLDELGEREDLNLSQQDCTAIMKICIRLGKFDVVDGLFNWFKQSGYEPSVVMYTTLIHSHYSERKYREALALVWEMEASNCLLDLPAYRVVIKLFVALNDISRAVRYFSKLKEAGFSPTYDMYRELIKIYMVSGRLAKCKEVCKEAEIAGFKLDKGTTSRLLQFEREKKVLL